VFDLRNGRDPRPGTIARVRAYLEGNVRVRAYLEGEAR
jgi:hypothetical protein